MSSTVWVGLCAAGVAIATLGYVLFGPELWRSKARCAGLVNLGNTCFMNAVLQALASLPAMSEWIGQCQRTFRGRLLTALDEVLLKLSTEEEVVPTAVVDGLLRHGWLIDRQEQDALELLHVLLGSLEEELSSTTTVMSDLPELMNTLSLHSATSSMALTRFGQTVAPRKAPACPLRGLLMSTLTCCHCRHTLPVKYEFFETISLPVPQSHFQTVDLEYCLRSYVDSEVVHGVECPSCGQGKSFMKQMRIGRAPTSLCLHISRTVWLPDGTLHKSTAFVSFPSLLDLSKFMSNKQRPCKYKLHAVVEHLGGPHSGHYCTFRRCGPGLKQWAFTSDTMVYSVSLSEVRSAQAYLLLYQRSN